MNADVRQYADSVRQLIEQKAKSDNTPLTLLYGCIAAAGNTEILEKVINAVDWSKKASAAKQVKVLNVLLIALKQAGLPTNTTELPKILTGIRALKKASKLLGKLRIKFENRKRILKTFHAFEKLEQEENKDFLYIATLNDIAADIRKEGVEEELTAIKPILLEAKEHYALLQKNYDLTTEDAANLETEIKKIERIAEDVDKDVNNFFAMSFLNFLINDPKSDIAQIFFSGEYEFPLLVRGDSSNNILNNEIGALLYTDSRYTPIRQALNEKGINLREVDPAELAIAIFKACTVELERKRTYAENVVEREFSTPLVLCI